MNAGRGLCWSARVARWVCVAWPGVDVAMWIGQVQWSWPADAACDGDWKSLKGPQRALSWEGEAHYAIRNEQHDEYI